MVQNLPANARDAGLISGMRRSPGEGNGNSLQYSCLENPMNRGAWQATVHGGCRRLGHDLVTKQQWLIYNVVLVSGAQQGELVTCIQVSTLVFLDSFPIQAIAEY